MGAAREAKVASLPHPDRRPLGSGEMVPSRARAFELDLEAYPRLHMCCTVLYKTCTVCTYLCVPWYRCGIALPNCEDIHHRTCNACARLSFLAPLLTAPKPGARSSETPSCKYVCLIHGLNLRTVPDRTGQTSSEESEKGGAAKAGGIIPVGRTTTPRSVVDPHPAKGPKKQTPDTQNEEASAPRNPSTPEAHRRTAAQRKLRSKTSCGVECRIAALRFSRRGERGRVHGRLMI